EALEHARFEQLALDAGVVRRDLEGDRGGLEFLVEVVPTVGVEARQHADAQRGDRHRQALVAVYEIPCPQLAEDLFPAKGELAEGEGGVDVLDDQLVAAVARVEI